MGAQRVDGSLASGLESSRFPYRKDPGQVEAEINGTVVPIAY